MYREVYPNTGYFVGTTQMTSITNIIRLLHDVVKMQKIF